MKPPKILECTLRDGSYEINFQFTATDTYQIAQGLERVGFDLIETGHGVGLGASEKGMGVAVETDEAYMKATADAVKNANWGMFCIPGIAELHHVDLAAEYGMNFIRIGTNVADYLDSKPFIEKAKHYGMTVCSNFMKSYVTDPHDFAQKALMVEQFGTDVVYIVDSAGGMLPSEITMYVEAIREKCESLKLGFHGHNNLGMGVANTLTAHELGVEILDSSLQGFGRSAGNTPTEQLLCALMRMGIDMNIDPIAAMDLAEKFVHPHIQSRGISSIDMTAGLALFHSSYMPVIEHFATQYRVDPRRLIIAVCAKDKTKAPKDLVELEAQKLSEQGVKGTWKPLFKHYIGGEQS